MTGGRRLSLVVALVFGVLAQTVGASAQMATQPPPPPTTFPLSCASPPSGVTATPQDRDRFLQLWLPRVQNESFLDAFAAQPTVPADIAQEGFHGLNSVTRTWLVSCLVDLMLAAAAPGDQQSTPDQLAQYQFGLNLVIFGKGEVDDLRRQLAATTVPPVAPAASGPTELTGSALQGMADELASQPSLTPASQPEANATTATPTESTDLMAQASADLQAEVAAGPGATVKVAAGADAAVHSTVSAPNPDTLLGTLGPILNLPLVEALLEALANIQTKVGDIQQKLFTLPGGNILGGAFYRVCSESATLPLTCSISLPVGVPIPVDATGDGIPDVLCELIPTPTLGPFFLTDLNVNFIVSRLPGTTATPLPAHVFAVYDPPALDKRIEYGYDGRASTLADTSSSTFTLHNAFQAAAGNVSAGAQIRHTNPGAVSGVTFAVKSLVGPSLLESLLGGSLLVPKSEADQLTGAVQFAPVPTDLTLGARFTHTAAQDEDVFDIKSSTPSTVNAVVDQATTTTNPKSGRRFTALVDQLPTSVSLDLVHQGATQTIHYAGAAPIGHVRATDTATADTGHPGSLTRSVYDVVGVPTDVKVALQGAQDVQYNASAVVPEASYSTQTLTDNVLQRQILARTTQIPSSIHIANATTPDTTNVTYDANGTLGSLALGLYDLNQDKTTLNATATSIPGHMQLLQTKSTGMLDVAANAPIGVIQATLSRGGGQLLDLPGDHATLLKQGPGLGLELTLSGLKAAHVEPAQKALYSLTLDPGGQAFLAQADMDVPNVLADLAISQLPASMQVTIDPVAGAAQYTASSVIPDLHGSFTKRDTGTLANLELTQLPKNVGLTFATGGSAPQVTYTADSRMGSIDGLYQAKPGGLAFHARITDLPEHMLIGGQDPIVFDARTSPTAAPGSSFLGQALFQYATDGTFESPPTTDDHAYINTAGAANHVEVLYSGLQFLSVDTAGQQLHAAVRNTSPRLLRAFLTTPNLTLTGFIDKVPAEVRVDQVGNDVQYHTTSPINRIFTDLQRSNGDRIVADAQSVPASVDLLFDAANAKLNWSASSSTGGISVVAHLTPSTTGNGRPGDAAVTLVAIPTQWNASWGDGNVLFEAAAPGIGSISAQVTNHSSFSVLPGDHLSVVFDQPSGDLDASLRVSNLTKAAFSKVTNGGGGGLVADLNMGSHGALGLNAQVNLGADRLSATGGFDHLPTLIHLQSDGGRIQYTGNDNPTLTLAVAAGNSAALGGTPAPLNVHGISIRDGASGTGKAVRAHVFLTGLPDSLDLNTPAGTYTVGNYHPTIDPLVVDAVLTTLAPQPLTLELQQVVGTASPVSFRFGPFTSSTAGDGTHNLGLNYAATRDMGTLTAEATYGNTDDARLTIGTIPGGANLNSSSISVNAAFGGTQKTVGIAMTHGIGDITASYKHAGEATFAASVHLHNVPSAVNLRLGRASAGDASKSVSTPDFTFTTSAPGMDIDAFASAEIVQPANITAAAQLKVTDLGSAVTGQLDGLKLHITSTPATGSFLLTAAGTININQDLGFDSGPFVNTGTLTVNANIQQLTLGFTAATDLGLELGIATALTGSFGSFTFGEQSDTVVTVDDHFKVHVKLPKPFGGVDIHLLDINNATFDLHNVIDHFHLSSNRFGSIFDIPVFEAFLASCHVNLEARPRSEGNTAGSSFTLPAPPSDGSHTPAWLITPDPNFSGFTLPDFALDVIAFFTSPLGNGIKVTFGCHLGP